MKALLALLAAIVIAQSSAAADKKYVFALVPKNTNNPFFDQARDGCKKAEKELNGAIECLYVGPGEHGGGDCASVGRDQGRVHDLCVFG